MEFYEKVILNNDNITDDEHIKLAMKGNLNKSISELNQHLMDLLVNFSQGKFRFAT